MKAAKIMFRLARCMCVIAAVLVTSAAIAQPYPARSVRFIVPFPPGGGTDTVARAMAQKVSNAWGQQVWIDNRPGAQGTIGTALGAKAAADGYTLTFAYVGTMAIAPWMYKNLGYDPLRDFVHVTHASSQPLLIVVHPSLPAKNLKDLVNLARLHGNKLTFASTGQFPQMAGELFNLATSSKILHVPYKGAGQAIIDLLAGNVVIMFSNAIASSPHVQTGKLRGLATTGSIRLPALPNVPTTRQAGFPDLEMSGWYGVSAPANTPKEIIAKINLEFRQAVQLPDVKERFSAAGIDAIGNSSEEFTAYVKSEYERWGKVVKESGVTAD